MDWVDKPQNYNDLYGILQLLRGSHLNNFLLKTLKLGWVAFHSVTFQLKCLDFQSNQYKKLVPVLSRFCNELWDMISVNAHTYASAREHTHTKNERQKRDVLTKRTSMNQSLTPYKSYIREHTLIHTLRSLFRKSLT